MKLELAIIENIQREDLNAVDRARAFERLANEFGFKHHIIAQKVGKSREYVSNTLRLLTLPPDILDALSQGKISEGHARPLMMLTDRTEEQLVLFKEITLKKLTVREAEGIARRIAVDRVRKKERAIDPEIIDLEDKLREALGTRVQIERRDVGGKVMIDFFSNDDLKTLLDIIQSNGRPPAGGRPFDWIISSRVFKSSFEKKSIITLPPTSRRSIWTRVPRASRSLSSRSIISGSIALSFFRTLSTAIRLAIPSASRTVSFLSVISLKRTSCSSVLSVSIIKGLA